MRRRRGIASVIAAVALMMVLTTSCARYEFGLTVESDGSGSIGIMFAVPPDIDQPLLEDDAPEGATPFEADDGWHGWQISLPFSTPSDIDIIRGALNEDAQALHDFTLVENDDGGWTYKHVIPAFTRFDTSALDFGTPSPVSGGFYRIRVSLPGDPVSDNATRIDEGAFVWDLDVTDDSPYSLQASTRSIEVEAPASTAEALQAEPTATPEAAESADEDGGFPFLVIFLILCALSAGTVGVLLLLKRMRARQGMGG